MQKTPYVFPIIGGRKVEQLEGNLEALDISLSDEQIKYLESVVEFDLGFPGNFIVSLFHLSCLFALLIISTYYREMELHLTRGWVNLHISNQSPFLVPYDEHILFNVKYLQMKFCLSLRKD